MYSDPNSSFASNPNANTDTRAAQAAADALGHKLFVVKAGAESDFEAAFAVLLKERPGALVVAADAYLSSQRYQIVALAARMAIPAIYFNRDFLTAGGLMSYATSLPEIYRQQGIYAGRILQGAKVSDLPVMLPAKF